MQFECPVCQKALHKKIYEGTNTYPCADGCGVFLGRKNLRIIEESREQSISMASLPKTSDDRGSIKDCPKCKAVMKKRNYGELNSTVIDYCASCQGMWLDPGELEHIQVYYEAAKDFENRHKIDEADSTFACPKCDTRQPKAELCIQCGLVFSKHEARQQETHDRQASQASSTAELEFLFYNLMHIQVEQKYHLSEAILNFERKNTYKLTLTPAAPGLTHWRINEQNISGFSILGRNIFGLLYTFTMHMTDGLGNVVLRLHRRPRLYFHELEAYDENGVEFGLVKRMFSFFNRVVLAYDHQGQQQLRIVGPILSPWTFNVYDGNTRIAVMTKRWSGFLQETFTDADNFNIQFEGPFTSSKKRLSIAALMLIDSLYFEGNKSFINHLISAPGIQLIAFIGAVWWMVSH
jgi:Zn-finger nucleic acid-binding protein/uncharacterized protein YxjI